MGCWQGVHMEQTFTRKDCTCITLCENCAKCISSEPTVAEQEQEKREAAQKRVEEYWVFE